MILLHHLESPLGPLHVATHEGRLVAVHFDGGDFSAAVTRLVGADVPRVEAPAPPALAAAFAAWFAGRLDAFDGFVLEEHGTPFQREVWAALRTIPAGSTLSYGELARRLGKPGAARAVGAANHDNPLGIVTPCHRVVGATGTLTGYAGGLDRKAWLLAHERRHAGLFAARGAPEPAQN